MPFGAFSKWFEKGEITLLRCSAQIILPLLPSSCSGLPGYFSHMGKQPNHRSGVNISPVMRGWVLGEVG